MGSSRRKFSPEFRGEAVREVMEQSRPIADVSRSLGIAPQTLGNWVAKHRRSHAQDDAALSVEERYRIRELERRIADPEEENRFLGKTVAFLARNRP